MKYNADYFIKFFEAIPDRKWCTRVYTDDEGRHCGYGHVYDASSGTDDIACCLRGIIWKIIRCDVSDVNDGLTKFCPARLLKFKRPRTRILHALREAKKQGY